MKDIYESDKFSISEFLSTRSILYNLEPKNIGTPYTESLTSYIARIAQAHHISVGKLLKSVIEPHLEHVYLKAELSKGNNKNTVQYINENNLVTLDYVRTLDKITGRTDLIYLTLLNWQGIFNRNIVGEYKKWCPICFEEMKENDTAVYEPLLWIINAINKCDIHKVKLEEFCSKCNKRMPHLHSQVIVGYCQYCGQWLGSSTGKSSPLNESEHFIIKNYKLLIENAPKMKNFPSNQFIKLFLLQMQKELNLSSMQQIATKLKFKPGTVYNWFYDFCKASQYSLLKIAFELNTTIFQMIYDKDIFKIISLNEKKELSFDEIRFHLMVALKMEKPITISEFSRKLGVNRGVIKNNFPDLYSELVERERIYKEYFTIKEENHLRKLLSQAIEYEKPISLTQLAKDNGIPVRRFRKIDPDLSKKISSRYTQHLSEIKRLRVEKSLKELEQAINKFHEKGIYPSTTKVRKEISDPAAFMYKEVMEVWKKRIYELGYKSSI